MTETYPLFTEHAAPERVTQKLLVEQFNFFKNYIDTNSIIDAFNEFFLILNENRQVVFANKSLLNYLSALEVKEIIGNRPGELFECQFAVKAQNGCGTSKFCKTCGAVKAILNSLNGIEDIRECSISRSDLDTIDLRVWTKPFDTKIGDFVLFVFSDISNEKRREVLERTFFHDIMNTVGGIKSLSDLLNNSTDNQRDYSLIINKLSRNLIEEINSQKLLLSAERNDLVITKSNLNSSEIINELLEIYGNHSAGAEKRIIIEESSENFDFVTDKTLLLRSLGNMVKNALEASDDSKVSIGVNKANNKYIFRVNNFPQMPEHVRLQIFRRSFSTKGIGRGVGTFSMKLFIEKYLKGQVYFINSEDKGTTFFAELPLDF